MFAKLLTKYRERAGLNKTELAKSVGVSPSYIMNVEREETTPPSKQTIELICENLKLNKEERRELLYAAVTDKIKPEVLSVIQDYRAGFIAEQAIKEGIHGHQTAYAECPYCHKDFAIDVKGEDITVTGKVITKAKKV